MRIHPPDGVVGAGGMITNGINQEEQTKNSTTMTSKKAMTLFALQEENL